MPDAQPNAAADHGCHTGQPCTCHPPAAAAGLGSGGGAEGAATVALSRLTKGQTGRICECQLAPDDAALLRAMGLCTNARVRLCRAGEPCIVAIDCGKRSPARIVEDATRRRGAGGVAGVAGNWTGSRIGLARSLAERILVTIE